MLFSDNTRYNHFQEKSFEHDSKHFVSDNIFKRFKFDY